MKIDNRCPATVEREDQEAYHTPLRIHYIRGRQIKKYFRFSLAKINVTKWTTPNLSSKPVLVPHSQLHGCALSLLATETHMINSMTPLHTKFLCCKFFSVSTNKIIKLITIQQVNNLISLIFLWPWAKPAVCMLRQTGTHCICHVLLWKWSATAVCFLLIHK